MNDSAPAQGLNYHDGIKYLADVAATYSRTLDDVAKGPFIAYVNAAITGIQDHIRHQERVIHEQANAIEESANPVPAPPSDSD